MKSNMKMTRIATLTVLLLSLITLGACKKTVYQTTNQVFSATYSIKTTDWVVDASGNNQYKVDLNVPEVDDLIVSGGGVIVYLSFDGGTTFDATPESYAGFTYNAFHSKSTVEVGYRADNGGAASLPNGDVLAKVIVLDGTPL